LDALKANDRRAVVPAYLRNRVDRRAAARVVIRYYGHVATFHTVRIPAYYLRIAARSPVGVGRILYHVTRWTFDRDGAELHRHAIRELDIKAHLDLSETRKKRIRARVVSTLVAAGAVATGGLIVPDMLPAWADTLAALGGLGVLGLIGRPKGRPLITRAVIAGDVEKLTSDIVLRALTNLGIAAMSEKNAHKITFPEPITRDGPGYRVTVDLPWGVTVAMVLDKRRELASGLRRPLGCVWPEGDVEAHEGRLILWVGDKELRKQRQPAWPLNRAVADVFNPLPFGVDVRGGLVTVELMFANLLLGAMPRQGKTATLRGLLLAVALDANCEIRIFELKGTGDLEPVAPCCHAYASGADDPSKEAAMASLRDLYQQLETRAAKIRELAAHNRALVPDNKVTPQVSGDRRHGLWPIVCAIDECQELFSDEDYKKEAERLAVAIIKRGPALGIMLLLATQRPDKDSLPKSISANVALRFCLKVDGQVENDMVLGTSSYQNGLRATMFTPKLDAGIGILKGEHAEPKIVRSFYFKGPESERIGLRARDLRAAAGTLTGHAIGEDPTTEEAIDRLLGDILTVVDPGTPKVWSETVVDALAEALPGIYAEWGDLESGTAKATQLAAALKPYGVKTGQMWLDGSNKMGISREAIVNAITERDKRRAHA
jgi:S-DNA-T family DNA segregation ATPase FtsK/SpoIIIE